MEEEDDMRASLSVRVGEEKVTGSGGVGCRAEAESVTGPERFPRPFSLFFFSFSFSFSFSFLFSFVIFAKCF
jgi:hypothetical protein